VLRRKEICPGQYLELHNNLFTREQERVIMRTPNIIQVKRLVMELTTTLTDWKITGKYLKTVMLIARISIN